MERETKHERVKKTHSNVKLIEETEDDSLGPLVRELIENAPDKPKTEEKERQEGNIGVCILKFGVFCLGRLFK